MLVDAADRYSRDPQVDAALRKAIESLHSDSEYRLRHVRDYAARWKQLTTSIPLAQDSSLITWKHTKKMVLARTEQLWCATLLGPSTTNGWHSAIRLAGVWSLMISDEMRVMGTNTKTGVISGLAVIQKRPQPALQQGAGCMPESTISWISNKGFAERLWRELLARLLSAATPLPRPSFGHMARHCFRLRGTRLWSVGADAIFPELPLASYREWQRRCRKEFALFRFGASV